MTRAKKAPKRAPKKAPAKKRAAKKAPAPKKRGRPPTDPAKLAAAVAAVAGGADYDTAAAEHGVGERVLREAVKKAESPASAAKVEPLELDPESSALDNARKLLDHAVRSIGKLPAGSSRLNPAHANARAMLKLIDELESRRGDKETPEAIAERKRREDGATRKAIEQHVIAYEAQAARDGVCVHCGAPLGARGAAT